MGNTGFVRLEAPSMALWERDVVAGRSCLRHCSCSAVKVQRIFLAGTTGPPVVTAWVVLEACVENPAGLKGLKIGINQISWLQVS